MQAILPKRIRGQDHARMKFWSWQKENLPSIGHSVRTALAATASVIVARLVQMPEAYWAAIATLVVMQSSLGATLTLSIERIIATALGASVGALEAHSLSRSFSSACSPMASSGEDRLSLRKRDVGDYRFDSALEPCMDCSSASIH